MANEIKDTEKIKRKIWDKFSQAMKRIPEKEQEIYHDPSTPTSERQRIYDTYLAKVSISLLDDIVATLDEKTLQAYNDGDAEQKARIVSTQLTSILSSQNRESLFLVNLTGFKEQNVKKIFTTQDAKLEFLKDFEKRAINTDLSDIFEIHQTLQDSEDIIELSKKLSHDEKLFCTVRAPIDKTIAIGNKYSNDAPVDFSNFIIIGDFDSGKQVATEALKLLPHAVVGKLNISSWKKELFGKIKTLPYAETIDCSHSINSLNDLDGKLPDGLNTLVVQDSLIKPTALTKDESKLTTAKTFMAAHPNLHIVSTNKNGDITFDLQESLAGIDKPKDDQAIGKNKRTESAPAVQKNADKKSGKKTETKKIMSFDDTINDLIAHQRLTYITPEITYEELRMATQAEIDQNGPVSQVTSAFAKRVLARIEKQRSERENNKSNTSGENVQGTDSGQQHPDNLPPQENANFVHARTQNKILKFIKKSFVPNAKLPGIKDVVQKFNIWNQNDNKAKSCVYIDSNGKEQTMPNLLRRANDTYTYTETQNRNFGIDFKSTALKDTAGNDIKDDKGNTIYVVISTRVYTHNKKDIQKHKSMLNGTDIYVSDQPLSEIQKNSIRGKHPGQTIIFFNLNDLNTDDYISYVYDPQKKPDETSAKESPQQQPIVDKAAVIEDTDNAFKPVNLSHATDAGKQETTRMTVGDLKNHIMDKFNITERQYDKTYKTLGANNNTKWFTEPFGSSRRFRKEFLTEYENWFSHKLKELSKMTFTNTVQQWTDLYNAKGYNLDVDFMLFILYRASLLKKHPGFTIEKINKGYDVYTIADEGKQLSNKGLPTNFTRFVESTINGFTALDVVAKDLASRYNKNIQELRNDLLMTCKNREAEPSVESGIYAFNNMFFVKQNFINWFIRDKHLDGYTLQELADACGIARDFVKKIRKSCPATWFDGNAGDTRFVGKLEDFQQKVKNLVSLAWVVDNYASKFPQSQDFRKDLEGIIAELKEEYKIDGENVIFKSDNFYFFNKLKLEQFLTEFLGEMMQDAPAAEAQPESNLWDSEKLAKELGFKNTLAYFDCKYKLLKYASPETTQMVESWFDKQGNKKLFYADNFEAFKKLIQEYKENTTSHAKPGRKKADKSDSVPAKTPEDAPVAPKPAAMPAPSPAPQGSGLVQLIALQYQVDTLVHDLERKLDAAEQRVKTIQETLDSAQQIKTDFDNAKQKDKKLRQDLAAAATSGASNELSNLLQKIKETEKTIQEKEPEYNSAEQAVAQSAAELAHATQERDKIKAQFNLAKSVLTQRNNAMQERALFERMAKDKDREANELNQKLMQMLGEHSSVGD